MNAQTLRALWADAWYGVLSMTAIFAISCYRRFVSPKKGYRCAHGILHGPGQSCSDRALRTLRQDRFPLALQNITNQFALCAAAHDQLRELFDRGSTDLEEGKCCEFLVTVKEWYVSLNLSEQLGTIYLVFSIMKYSLAGLYHLGTLGSLGSFAYGILGAGFIGSAGSALFPVVLISVVLDYFIIQRLFARKNAIPFVASQYALSLLVIVADPYLEATLLAMNNDSGVGVAGVAANEYVNTRIENFFDSFFRFFKAKSLAFFWGVLAGVVCVINYLDCLATRPK